MTSSGAARLLIVDDEPQIIRALTPALQATGYDVQTAETGAAALNLLASDAVDLIVLDLGLPDMDGKDVILRVREWSDAPIVILSARDLEDEKIKALDLGADDFVNKPVGIGELLARIRAALRGRERRWSSQAVIRSGDVEVDFAHRRVTVQGEEVKLPPREYSLLRTLARHAGKVVTHRQVIAAVWGADANIEVQVLRVVVGQLRQKIEAEPAHPTILITEPGIGYRLRVDE